MKIIPKPNGEIKVYDEKFIFTYPKLFYSSKNISEEMVNIFLNRLKLNKDNINTNIKLIEDSSISCQNYQLFISNEEINIIASDSVGFNYGLISLYHLYREKQNKKIEFNDFPKYKHREFMIDSARNFISIEEIKKIIDQASLMKLNFFHWHLTDNQGWRIESTVFPSLNEIDGEKYTQKEIKEIVRYAKNRGIEIIPEIDIPGHVQALLTVYKDLSCDKKERSIIKGYSLNNTPLCLGQKETYYFIFKLFDEVMSLFPCKYFHIGADEVSLNSCSNCSNCKNLMKKNNFKNYKQLYGYFINIISKYLINNGKFPICWNDATQASNLNDKIIIQHWFDYPFDKTNIKTFEKQQQYIVSSTFSNYFDYPYCLIPLKSTYEFVPKIKNKQLNNKLILGTSCHIWTEIIENIENLENLLFPRLYAFSENSWSNNLNYNDFEERLEYLLNNLAVNINYATSREYNIHGEEASKEIIEYFSNRLRIMPKLENISIKNILSSLKITIKLLSNNQKGIVRYNTVLKLLLHK